MLKAVGGVGAIAGGVGGYIDGGWDGAMAGAGQGLLDGALAGGMAGAIEGFLDPRVCFTAGTQVVTGIETESTGTPYTPLHESETQFASSNSAAVATAPAIRSYITQSIESLRPGDLILARDQHDPNAGLVLRRIEELFTRTTYRLLHLTLQDSHGTLQTLHTTAEHPVYALGHGWLAAGKLKPGDALAQTNGQTSHLLAIESTLHPEGLPVYNLRVAEAHTYHVRAEGSNAEPVWVHNACGPKANHGVGPKHGNGNHDAAIEAEIAGLPDEAINIRKNQAQVDVLGNKVGDNRPDLQYDLKGEHYNHEFDHSAVRSNHHAVTIQRNDPAAWIIRTVLGG